MKTGNYYLSLAVVIGFLCVPILGEVEPAMPDGILLGQPNPALADVDNLYVWITLRDFEPNSYGLALEKLESSIIDKIEKADVITAETSIDKMEPNSTPAKMTKILKRRIDPANVKNLKFRPYRVPELRVDIDTLNIKPSQQVVFRVQTSLARLVQIEKKTGFAFKTDVWQSEPVMQTVLEENMPAAVTDAALEQVEEFIHAYLAANPPDKQVPDENDIGIIPKVFPKPAIKSIPSSQRDEPAEYKYVASKNSNVFHSPGCSSAKRIKPENLVGYRSRDEAINAGKRPCKRCKP